MTSFVKCRPYSSALVAAAAKTAAGEVAADALAARVDLAIDKLVEGSGIAALGASLEALDLLELGGDGKGEGGKGAEDDGGELHGD
jgi:hypothetical protein